MMAADSAEVRPWLLIVASYFLNLKKGAKVTEDYLNSLDKDQWLDIRIRDEKINLQLEKLAKQLTKQKNNLIRLDLLLVRHKPN